MINEKQRTTPFPLYNQMKKEAENAMVTYPPFETMGRNAMLAFLRNVLSMDTHCIVELTMPHVAELMDIEIVVLCKRSYLDLMCHVCGWVTSHPEREISNCICGNTENT